MAEPTAELDGHQLRATQQVGRRLARPLEYERVWAPDREAMLAALRVALDLPRQLPERGLGGAR